MSESYLVKQYSHQMAGKNQLTNSAIQATSIRAIIDPRFDTILNRSVTPTQSNRIAPDTSSPAFLIPTLPQVKKRRIFPTSSTHRLQGLLIGVLIGIISVAIILAVLLRKSSSSTVTYTPSPCTTLQWNPVGITIVGNGTNGNQPNQLNGPQGVSLDSNDNVYIADTGNHRILSIALGANGTNTGTVIAGITGVPSDGSGALNTPFALYVDSQKNLYIADTYNSRIQFWSYGASNGSTVAGSSLGIAGATLDKLGNVYGFYVDQSNNIYVPDILNHRIVKWATGASTGILVAGNGSIGYDSTQLAYPLSITLDSSSGILYITELFSEIIVAWPLGSTAGTIVAGSNLTQGDIPSLLNNPWSIMRDSYGNLYVSDYSNHRIQMFCPTESSFSTGRTIAGVGLSQSSSMGLSFPTGIAFDSQMNLYIADGGNNRIQKFLRTN